MKQSDFEVILQEGESYKVEFKETVDKSLVEEACAFANASGGRIFIGVSDDRKITGTDVSNSSRSRIQDTLRKIQPNLNIKLDVFKEVIIITIPEGNDKPYGCSKGFFLRVGPNSQKLGRNEIISFIQSEGRVRFDELVKLQVNFEENLNSGAFERYLKMAEISNVLPKKNILHNLDCIVSKNNEYFFTNAGVLFFSNEPVKYIPQSTVVCALYKGKKKVTVLDRKDLSGDLVTAIDEAVIFLKKHLNLRYEIKGIQRKEILEIPEIAIREAVINAVCHRDYFEKGANVMVEIFDDRVEISNPGSLPHGLTIEDFGKRSLSRNPTIASLLHRINYIEKMGTGINRMRQSCKEAGIPEPKFHITSFFTIVFKRIQNKKYNVHNENFGEKFGENFGENINQTQFKILECIFENPKVSAKKIAEQLNLSTRAIEHNIKSLKEKRVIGRRGSAKGGHWIILKEDE